MNWGRVITGAGILIAVEVFVTRAETSASGNIATLIAWPAKFFKRLGDPKVALVPDLSKRSPAPAPVKNLPANKVTYYPGLVTPDTVYAPSNITQNTVVQGTATGHRL